MPTLRPGHVTAPGTNGRVPTLNEIVDILWEDRDAVFRGRICCFDAHNGKFQVCYEDGDVLWQDLTEHYWKGMGDTEWVRPFSARVEVRTVRKKGGLVSKKGSRNLIRTVAVAKDAHRRVQKKKGAVQKKRSRVLQTPQNVIFSKLKKTVQDQENSKNNNSRLIPAIPRTMDCKNVIHATSASQKQLHAFSETSSLAKTENSFSEMPSPTTIASGCSVPHTPFHLSRAFGAVEKQENIKFEGLQLRCVPPRKRFVLGL